MFFLVFRFRKGVDLVTKTKVDAVIQLCRTLKEDLPMPPTPENLSAKPDEEAKYRLHSLLPVPS